MERNYFGCCYKTEDHYWLDGMIEESAYVWDTEKHEEKIIKIGYYGMDGRNLVDTDNLPTEIDITTEAARDMIRTYKKRANIAFADSVTARKNRVEKGSVVEVFKGRKVKKGTRLEVFWCGERETYQSRQYSWMNETELIAGCRPIGADPTSKPIWIKAEYLKVLNKPKSPVAAEREKFIKAYIQKLPKCVLVAARG